MSVALVVMSAEDAPLPISPNVTTLTFLPVPCMYKALLSYATAFAPVCAGCVPSLLIVKLNGVIVKSCSEPYTAYIPPVDPANNFSCDTSH